MNRKIKVAIAFILITIITYGIAWGQMYFTSKKYYKDAVENYNKGQYDIGIKGKKVEKEDRSGYEFKGGFQQVREMWDSPYALPKPKVYAQANDMINEIVNKKINIKTGMEMFNKYFKMDKNYLDIVMIKVADLYIEANDIEGARETLKLVEEAFPQNDETQKIVKEKLAKLN